MTPALNDCLISTAFYTSSAASSDTDINAIAQVPARVLFDGLSVTYTCGLTELWRMSMALLFSLYFLMFNL